jgi:hypothetical protein
LNSFDEVVRSRRGGRLRPIRFDALSSPLYGCLSAIGHGLDARLTA